ncbi:MAG TPA: hypothetical protein VG148_11745 [Pyrinomonadaceae bacterium]|nr:hypothetical protein [Pyrinomonadaceae bacterium]
MRPRGTAPALTFFAALALSAAAAASLWAAEAGAQCALCRTALKDAGEATARAMNTGILVLLIPPVAIFCTIFAVAYRKGKKQ